MKAKTIILWTLQILAAAILLQTLFFKFSGAQESINIFMQLGVEPWGRWASGLTELVAGILLLRASTAAYGGIMAAGIMVGALLSHVFVLGFTGNNGSLAALAAVVLVSSIVVSYLRRASLLKGLQYLRKGHIALA